MLVLSERIPYPLKTRAHRYDTKRLRVPQSKPHRLFWNRTSPEAELLLDATRPFFHPCHHRGGSCMSSPTIASGNQVLGSGRAVPLSWVLLLALLVHGPLLLLQLPLDSYDAHLHQFFAAHYAQHWMALFSHVMGLNLAYLLVQLIAILLLPIGVYRYARIWVSDRAASYAAVGSVLLGSLSFLVYQAGQLSTTWAAPLYLNA